MSYIILSIIIGYLFGSIPSGYIAGKIAGRDIRKEGYRRIGASNVYSVLGFLPAVGVFFGDFLKGIIPILLLKIYGVEEPIASLAGIFAILGHNWPIFVAFKGEGRGLATSFGVLYYLLPLETIAGFAIFILLTIKTKSSPLPTFIFACIMPISTLLFPEPLWIFFFSLAISFILILRRIIGGFNQIKERKGKCKTVLNLMLYDSAM